jgi:hypothetical protein
VTGRTLNFGFWNAFASRQGVRSTPKKKDYYRCLAPNCSRYVVIGLGSAFRGGKKWFACDSKRFVKFFSLLLMT